MDTSCLKLDPLSSIYPRGHSSPRISKSKSSSSHRLDQSLPVTATGHYYDHHVCGTAFEQSSHGRALRHLQDSYLPGPVISHALDNSSPKTASRYSRIYKGGSLDLSSSLTSKTCSGLGKSQTEGYRRYVTYFKYFFKIYNIIVNMCRN